MSRDFNEQIASIISGSISEEDAVVVPSQISWNEGQRAAIERVACGWGGGARFMSLTGAAGTGKTTVLQEIRRRLMLFQSTTVWSAMTGKAASRMREAARVAARTLHGALYQPPRLVDRPEEKKIDLEFDTMKDIDDGLMLVVDEASMISPKIWADVERSPYDRILLVGDPYQIPPVLSKNEEQEQGADYSVFSGIEGAHLTEVMRAAGAVLEAATFVRENQQVPQGSASHGASEYDYLSAANFNVGLEVAVSRYLEDPIDHVLITWRNDVRNQVNMVIRRRLGLDPNLPQPDELMVVRKNLHEHGLMNGDIVRLIGWVETGPDVAGVKTRYVLVQGLLDDDVPQKIFVAVSDFTGTLPYVPLNEWRRAIDNARCPEPIPLTYAYCLTAHLSQGSEYRRVTTLLSSTDLNNRHFNKWTQVSTGEKMKFSMRFLYTALSRARQRTSLIVS